MSEKCLRDDPKKQPTTAQLVAWLEWLLDNHVSGESNARMVQDKGSQFPEAPRVAQPIIFSEAPAIVAMPNILEAARGSAEPIMRETYSGNSSSIRQAPRGSDSLSMFCDELRQCFSMSEFVAATRNFSNIYILYDGVYRIYRGPYPSNSKTSSYIIYRGMRIPADISKLEEASHLSHPNLSSMAGYCCSDGETIVGYNNEGLCILLHQLSYDHLSWLKRLKICIGAAEALRCIHTARIIHGDISPTTILLDNSSCAKLVTFGSVLSQWTGYNVRLGLLPLDIEGFTEPTEKTDIYLFGLLLLILFCGKKTDYSNGYPFLLPVKVCEAIKRRTLHQITDLNLRDVAEECLNKFLTVAFCCFSPEQVHRPSMDTVVEGLKEAQALQRRSLKTLNLLYLLLLTPQPEYPAP